MSKIAKKLNTIFVMFILGTFNKECEFEYDICQKNEYDFRHIKINKFYLTTNYFPFPNSTFLCRLSFFLIRSWYSCSSCFLSCSICSSLFFMSLTLHFRSKPNSSIAFSVFDISFLIASMSSFEAFAFPDFKSRSLFLFASVLFW